MATGTNGIVTYEDLYNEFSVSDTVLPIPYDQCPTYQQIVDNFPELQITGNYQSNQLVMFKDISFANEDYEVTIYNEFSSTIGPIYAGPKADDGYAWEGSDFVNLGRLDSGDFNTGSITVQYGASEFGICMLPPISSSIDFENDGFNWGLFSSDVRGKLRLDTDSGMLYGNLPLGPGIYLGTGYQQEGTYSPILIGCGANYTEFDTEFTQFYLSLKRNNSTLFAGDLSSGTVYCSSTDGYFPAYDADPNPFMDSWGVRMEDLVMGSMGGTYQFSIQVTLSPQSPGYMQFILVPCDEYGSIIPNPTDYYIDLGKTDNSDGTFTHSTSFGFQGVSYDTNRYSRLALGIILLDSDVDYWQWN